MNLVSVLEKKCKPPSPSYNYQSKFVAQWIVALERVGKSVVNIGSGRGLASANAINVDIFPFENVTIVGDAELLPFKTEVLDGILCKALLEHIANPKKAIQEIHRCLKPDRHVYFETPFLQAGHLTAVGDYQRFTVQGLRNLLRQFECQDSGVCIGPFSVIAWYFRKMPTIITKSTLFIKAIEFVMGWLTFWIKYLDIFCRRLPNLEVFNAGVFFWGLKKAA